MKKLITFILTAVLVSCSQQETLKVKHKESVKNEVKEKDYPEHLKQGGSKGFYYERSLDTINVSGRRVIVAVYRAPKAISTVIISQ